MRHVNRRGQGQSRVEDEVGVDVELEFDRKSLLYINSRYNIRVQSRPVDINDGPPSGTPLTKATPLRYLKGACLLQILVAVFSVRDIATTVLGTVKVTAQFFRSFTRAVTMEFTML